ncbi:MAG: transcriptional repressor LexA [Candidatus Aminicenantes bacterium]|nr:transcriptional repressor LexA [Candidatus Aminicenantes bacterium]
MITYKQKVFLDSLKTLIKQYGYFPGIDEISLQMKLFSMATVQSYLKTLLENGYLTRSGQEWEISRKIPSIPLVGYVPAGSPDGVFENLGEEIELPEWMLDQAGDVVGFRVRGTSMIDAYIQDGDVVIVLKTSCAEPGDMVVAMLEESGITLKRLRKTGERFWLEPENPEYPSITDPFQVIGKVTGVMRKYP